MRKRTRELKDANEQLQKELTERERAEESLRASRDLLRSIIESVPIRVFWKDRESRYLGCNTLFALDAGWSRPEELIGKDDFQMRWAKYAELYRADDKRVMDSDTPKLGFEEPITTSSALIICTSKVPLHDADGKVFGMLGIYEDITERRQMEERIRILNEELDIKVRERTQQLLEAQEELVRKEKLSILGQLLGSVGHELRSPLSVMSNAIYYLKAVMPEADETVREYLDLIKNEINRSECIISDLLDFTRTKTPHLREITALELINRGLRQCSIPENLILTVDLPETLPEVKADPLQMGQVFQNLIMNSLQAMPDGGTLRITGRLSSGVGASRRVALDEEMEGRYLALPIKDSQTPAPNRDFVEISITDTGEGIMPENMKRLFHPLFTTKVNGIGLGLVVCKKHVEANGGGMEVESESGKGTTFTVILPAGIDSR
jgi:PAS domain S-box-containing protein